MVELKQTPPTNEPALELKLAPRDFVRIDGETYDLANMLSYGIRDRSLLAREASRLVELEQIEEPTEDDQREHQKRLDAIIRYALPSLPASVLEALDQAQKVAIVGTFFVKSADDPTAQKLLAAAKRFQRTPWTPSSPSSQAATAEETGS